MTKRFLPGTFTLLAIAAIVGSTIWYSGFSFRGGRAGSKTQGRPNLIQTAAPQRRDFQVTVPWIGRVESGDTVEIRTLEAGKIVSVEADDETKVNEGAPLFVLGGAKIDSRLVSLRGNVKSLRERLALAEQIVRHKQQAVRQRLSTLDEYDAAKASADRLREELTAATQELRRLEDGSRIQAPIGGTFTRRTVNVGQEVGKGEILAKIIAPGHIRIAATLFPAEGTPLEGRPARISTESGGTLSGVVTKIVAERTPAGGTTVWIEGSDIARELKPGETASGDISLATHKAALALPRSALVYDEHETPFVYVKDKTGYRKQRVRLGVESNGWVEIVSGVTERSDVAVQGAYELFYRDFSKTRVAD